MNGELLPEVKGSLARHLRETERLQCCEIKLEQAKAMRDEAAARVRQTTVDLIETLWGHDIEGDKQAYLKLEGNVYSVQRSRYGSFSIDRLTVL